METILIKLSGELFKKVANLKDVVCQISKLSKQYKLGIVVGAGNIFRGNQQGKEFGLRPIIAHTSGMIATIINGLIIQDLLAKKNIQTKLLSAIDCKGVADSITPSKIDCALQKNQPIIFVGGTGNPFFTTDTNAVLRALQIKAQQVWKGTKVEGIFDSDPMINKNAKLLKTVTYKQVIEQNLQIMDASAITLAQEHNLKIRIFNVFEKDSLLNATKNQNFGSIIN